jgi:HlyD family secretion protein
MRASIAAPIAGTLLLANAACAREERPDAYGNVEAVEVVVGAEASGRLVAYEVVDGVRFAADAHVGAIDPTALALERDQLLAQEAATASRVQEVAERARGVEAQRQATAAQRAAAVAQRDALAAQYEIARRNYDRIARLQAQQAATAQQLDAAERDQRVLAEQIRAQDQQVRAYEQQMAAHERQIQAAHAEQATIERQVSSAKAQVARVAERLTKTEIRNPVAGTVLTTYVRAGEFVQVGQPLYRIANLDAVEVRAYVTQPQLAAIRLGADADVTFDMEGGRQTLTGKITWVSPEAEFTPTPIQTREERADLVYAIKMSVANPQGTLKIGMPVDVRFRAPRASP